MGLDRACGYGELRATIPELSDLNRGDKSLLGYAPDPPVAALDATCSLGQGDVPLRWFLCLNYVPFHLSYLLRELVAVA